MKAALEPVCAAAILALVAAAPVTADSITLEPSKDNTLYEDAGGALSNGVGVNFFAGRNNSNFIRRGLVAFDVAGSIPSGSTITAVDLTMTLSQANSGLFTVSLLRSTGDWGEGTSNATSGGGGAGAASTTNDATWLHRFFNTVNWVAAGGDFSATISASLAIDATLGPRTWASTPQLVADVQDMLDNPANNFGWLVQGDESTNTTIRRFESRESTTPANRPQLAITYTPPSSVSDWAMFE